MHKKFPVLVWKEKDQYVSRCLDPEVASCGDTSEEALAGLKEALELYFEENGKGIEVEITDPHLTELEISV